MSKGANASSTRYRALQFFPALQSSGYRASHVTISGAAGGHFLVALIKAESADAVVVLRKTLPDPLLWLLRRVAKRLIFDFDDAIFCNSDGSASQTRMARFASMVSASDHVFAGNEFLSRKALAFNSAVTRLPTCLDVGRYRVAGQESRGRIDLVWIGSRATKKYLIEALPALRQAATRVHDLRLKIIADFDLPEAGIPVVAIPWNAETETDELASSHIGIAPMNDDDWTRGKCALKVIQYMASGLPVLSSAVGANAEMIESGRNGYLVTDSNSWVERIVTLARDDRLRLAMGQAGRERALAEYSLGTVASRLTAALDLLL